MKPIYPEIFTPDNTLQINTTQGQITIKEGQKFQIQDVVIDTTGRQDLVFTTEPNKIYHLRYSLNGRAINNFIPNKNSFYLVDTSDPNYNPNAVDEADLQFDTKYDDMLIAKIITDNNNNPTVIALKNRQYFNIRIQGRIYWGNKQGPQEITIPLNLARKVYPKVLVKGGTDSDESSHTLWLDATDMPDEKWKMFNHLNYHIVFVLAWTSDRYNCLIRANTEEHQDTTTNANIFGTPGDAIRFDLIVEG